jgi:hypothetical protein
MKSLAEVMSTNHCCLVQNEGKILWHYVNDPCKIIIAIILVSMFSSCWSWHKKCTFIVLLFLELPFAEWHSYGVVLLTMMLVLVIQQNSLLGISWQDEMYLLNHDKTGWYDHSMIKPVLYKCTCATLVCILLSIRVLRTGWIGLWSNNFGGHWFLLLCICLNLEYFSILLHFIF